MPQVEIVVSEARRLDVLCADGTGISRSQVSKYIEDGLCTIDSVIVLKPAYKTKVGQHISLDIPEAKESRLEAEDIPIHILYQDSDLAVVEKPRGMVVHPAAGNESGTLVNALLAKLDSLSGIGDEKRPGIIHRLDKDTSGLLIVAKNDIAHRKLSEDLAARKMEKHYLAIVEGNMKAESGSIHAPIGRSHTDRKKMAIVPEGRDALTDWLILEKLRNASLLDVHILTGRTHQIRVHMQSIGHSVAGDPIYGFSKGVKAPALMLHAYRLSFIHPVTGERMSFILPPPQDFLGCYKSLRYEAAAPFPFQSEE